MLLDTETALKVAHDIVHDAEEFLGGKWSRLLKSQSEETSGFVDFEFSDGSLIRVPCMWKIAMLAEGPERSELVLKNRGVSVTWKPGTVTAVGAFSGLIANGPIMTDILETDSIVGLHADSGDSPLLIENGMFDNIASAALIASGCVIDKIAADVAAIISPDIETIQYAGDGAYIDATLDALEGDSIDAFDLQCTGEQIVAVEKMNAWGHTAGEPETDAIYAGTIPFLPLTASAGPINGFDNPLASNPFFPDWFYVFDRTTTWAMKYAWVPTLGRPSKPAWRDSDGIYWHLAPIATNGSRFGAPNMVYPPRCQDDSGNTTVAPFIPEANGLVITVKHLGNTALPYALSDRYTCSGDDEWSWTPCNTTRIQGPALTQFVVRREFTITDNKIVAVEYQLLPLGETNAAV